MSKNRIIFYSLFVAYQVAGFVMSVVIDSNTSVLFSMAGYVSWFKYLSAIGVILVAVDVIWSWQQNRKVHQEGQASIKENNLLKAKLYDLQTAGKEVTSVGSK